MPSPYAPRNCPFVLRGLLLLGVLGLFAGCQTARVTTAEDAADVAAIEAANAEQLAKVEALEQAREFNRQNLKDWKALQWIAWQQLQIITEIWREVPPEYFPGLSTLVAQVDELRAEIELEDGQILVDRIDVEALTTRNPAYWRAALETSPGDPTVTLFAQMLWASRSYFDRTLLSIELQRIGPALPPELHQQLYAIADDMRRVKDGRQQHHTFLIEHLPAERVEEIVIRTGDNLSNDPEWVTLATIMRLRQAGVDFDDIDASAGALARLHADHPDDWALLSRNDPMLAARLSTDAEVRAAKVELDLVLAELSESRGAYGGRDLERLSEALAAVGFWDEALLARQRADALSSFTLPQGREIWWEWLPHLIGAGETARLRADYEAGAVWPVSFFGETEEPEGIGFLPLHPILIERSQRRLQEVERQLENPSRDPFTATQVRITQAETLAHLGRWSEALAALDAIPDDYSEVGTPMRVWIYLWSGDISRLASELPELDPESAVTTPALPALAQAALGDWAGGAKRFFAAAQDEEISTEYRTYYALMASSFARLAGHDAKADTYLDLARSLSADHAWVATLVQGMAGEVGTIKVGEDITEIQEAGRVCEARYYRAFHPEITAARQRALLEACVATGVVDFVEYTASLLRLRELEPARWDPQYEQPLEEPKTFEAEVEVDWSHDAEPSWEMPS